MDRMVTIGDFTISFISDDEITEITDDNVITLGNFKFEKKAGSTTNPIVIGAKSTQECISPLKITFE